LRHADAAALPYPDASFDSANIANAVHCFPDVDGALRETLRVLTPGATCAANVLLHPRGIPPSRVIANRINAWGMRKGILVCPYDEMVILDKLVEAGFEIVRKDVIGNTLNVLARKPAGISQPLPNGG
jgi:ubiquinone/menaquinone biosynthesis C-methylase UbiE